VEAAVTDLGLAEEWYGKFNREAQPLPVLDLRESPCAWACSASTKARS
jgi:hypothetical protein